LERISVASLRIRSSAPVVSFAARRSARLIEHDPGALLVLGVMQQEIR